MLPATPTRAPQHRWKSCTAGVRCRIAAAVLPPQTSDSAKITAPCRGGPSDWRMAKWLIGLQGGGEVWVRNDFTRRIALCNHFGARVILSNVDNALLSPSGRPLPAGRLPPAPAASWPYLPAPPRRIVRQPRHAPHSFHAGEDSGNLSPQLLAGRERH